MSLKGLCNTIFFGRYGEIARYIFFGVLNVAITWVTYALCVLAGISPSISNAISWVIGVSFAFVVNKLYVFYSKSREKVVVGKQAGLFVAGRIATGLIALFGFPLLYFLGFDQGFFGVDGFYDKMLMTVIETVLNYLVSKYLVFTDATTPEPMRE